MTSEYILIAKPGWDLREVGKNPVFKNAAIFEYRYGRLINIYPVTNATLRMFKPKLPPRFYEEETIGKISLDKPLPEGHFASGVSPFIQVLYRKAAEMEGAELSDLYRAVVSEFRIAPDTPETFEMVRLLVGWASAAPSYLVTFKEGGRTFYRAGKAPAGDPPLVPYTKGINPIEDQITQFVERKGMASYGEVKHYIIDGLGWLTSEGYLKDTIDKLVKNGNLKEFERGYYKFIKALEPF